MIFGKTYIEINCFFSYMKIIRKLFLFLQKGSSLHIQQDSFSQFTNHIKTLFMHGVIEMFFFQHVC